MNKIVNGVANDYEFPDLYDPNISYSKAYTEQLLAEKDKEIQRLKEVIQENDKEIDNLCKKQKKEIERLNNIINELEKELKEGSFDVYFCSTSSQKTFKSNEIIIKAMILDKLKELKEKKND